MRMTLYVWPSREDSESYALWKDYVEAVRPSVELECRLPERTGAVVVKSWRVLALVTSNSPCDHKKYEYLTST